MKKLADFFTYVSMVAGILVLTKPRKRPPLYIDSNGVFHWTIVEVTTYPGADAIRAAGRGYSETIERVIHGD